MSYTDKVIQHFENPKNVGSFKEGELGVGTGIAGAPACGDVMKLQIKIEESILEDGTHESRIKEARFKTFGCGAAIASSSLATTWLIGKTLEEAKTIKNQDIAKELSLPPVKIHCSILAEEAIRGAIYDLEQKGGKIISQSKEKVAEAA